MDAEYTVMPDKAQAAALIAKKNITTPHSSPCASMQPVY